MRFDSERIGIVLISLNQMAGGGLGIVTVTRAAAQYPDLRALGPLLALYAACGGTIFAGYALARGKPAGLWLSLIVQLLQILQLNVPRLGYEFLLGARMLFGVSGSGRFVLTAAFAANFRFQLSHPLAEPGFLGVNILAVFAAIMLIRNRKRISRSSQTARNSLS